MRRALAFCRDIKSSKLVREEFEKVVKEFQAQAQDEEDQEADALRCEVRHVDGTYNARARGQRLDWLKKDAGANVCRILSNARCLAEGVDIPALDAILFLHPAQQSDRRRAIGGPGHASGSWQADGLRDIADRGPDRRAGRPSAERQQEISRRLADPERAAGA